MVEISRRLVLIGLLAAPLLGCKKKGSGKPRVAVSIFPLFDVVRRIAGDRLDVVLVLPPGKSEHGYDPSPQDIAAFEGARLGFAVGLGMDTWIESMITSAGSGAKVIHLGDSVDTIPIELEPIGEEEHHEEEGEHHDDKEEKHEEEKHEEEKHEEEEHEEEEHHDEHGHAEVGAADPHFWLDPQRMIKLVDVIVRELTTLDAEGKDAFAAGAASVKESLTKLDAELTTRSKAWTKHTIVTFHGSMGYFAKRYGLRIAAVIEPIAGSESDPHHLGEVQDAIKKSGAAALFSEPQLDAGQATQIARDTGVPLGVLDPVGGQSGRDTYEALLRWNADQLDKLLK